MDDVPTQTEIAKGTRRIDVDDDKATFLEDAFREVDHEFELLSRDFQARKAQLQAEKAGIIKTVRAFLGIPDDWELREGDDDASFYFENPNADAVQDDEDDKNVHPSMDEVAQLEHSKEVRGDDE